MPQHTLTELNQRLSERLQQMLAAEASPPATPADPHILAMLEAGGEAGMPLAAGAFATPFLAPEAFDVPGSQEMKAAGRLRESDLGLAGFAQPLTRSLAGETPTYFSALRKVFEDPKLPERLDASQIRSMLVKQPGITKEELRWSGVDEMLARGGKTTKSEVLQQIDAGGVEIKEVMRSQLTPQQKHELSELYLRRGDLVAEWGYGRVPRVIADQIDTQIEKLTTSPVYSSDTHPNLSLPGGENYREVELIWGSTLKNRQVNILHELKQQIIELKNNPSDSAIRDAQKLRQLTAHVEDVGASITTFKNPHFPESDILAHARLTDRVTPDNKRVLFIEELQSDWHQRARAATNEGAWHQKLVDKKLMSEEAATMRNRPLIPDAPFRDTWPEMTMKRIVRMAADEGYDAVGWATGMQQQQRSNKILNERVDEIRWDGANLTGFKNNKQILHDNVTPPELPRIVGQDIANKLIESIPVPMRRRTPSDSSIPVHTVRGKDLTIGSRGHITHYDIVMPAAAKKIGKKFGSEPMRGRIQIDKQGKLTVSETNEGWYVNLDGDPFIGPTNKDDALASFASIRSDPNFSGLEGIHLLPLTPALRVTARREGFPLFQTVGAAGLSEISRRLSDQLREKQQQ